MTTRTRLRIILLTVLVSMLLITSFATCCKYVSNRYESAVSKSVDDLPAQTIAKARQRGSLVAELNCTPSTFTVDGSTILTGEGWVERRSRPEPHLVWFKKYELLDGFWLNFRLSEGALLFDEPHRLLFSIDPESLGSTENKIEGLPADQFVMFS